jgi:hypothetical protein
MEAYVQSEKEKHSNCTGHCLHSKENAELSKMLGKAFFDCKGIQRRIDHQLRVVLEHSEETGDLTQALRTFAIAMIEQGWSLAKFNLEGKKLDNLIQ